MPVDPRLLTFPAIKNVNVADKNLNLILQNMKERIERYATAMNSLITDVNTLAAKSSSQAISQVQQDARANNTTTVITEQVTFDDLQEAQPPPTDDVRYAAEDFIPAGVTTTYAGTTAPSGWLECDGSAVSRTTYVRLFSAIGVTWGSGNGSTTFNLPDMTDAYATGRGTDGVGATVGNLGSNLDLTHDHDEGTLVTANEGSHIHSNSGTTGLTASTVEVQSGTGTIVATDTHTHNYSNTTGAGSAHNHTITGSTGVNVYADVSITDPVDIRPDSRVFMWIIKT